MDEKESIWRQPISELLQKELSAEFLKKDLSADFLKKELTLPEFLKKEIPGGVLDRDVLFWKKRSAEAPDEDEIEQTVCFSCRKETPATVSTCVHCGAHIEATYKRDNYLRQLETDQKQDRAEEGSLSLLDLSDEIL